MNSEHTSELRNYIHSRRLTIEASIASERLAGNIMKEQCERAAMAEIDALEIQLNTRTPDQSLRDAAEKMAEALESLLPPARNNNIPGNTEITKAEQALAQYAKAK